MCGGWNEKGNAMGKLVADEYAEHQWLRKRGCQEFGMADIWGHSLGRWGKILRAAEQLVPSVMGCLFLPVEDI